MDCYTLYTPDSAPSPGREILAGLKRMIGFVPNVFAVMGAAPPVLRSFAELTTRFGETSLTATEQETVHITVSVENGCEYCVAGHTAFAEMKKVPNEIIAALRDGGTINDPKLAALRDFTRTVVRKRGHVGQDEVQRFLAAGYTTTQVQEVILGICEKTFSNLTSIVLNIPLDDAFRAHSWQRPAPAKAA